MKIIDGKKIAQQLKEKIKIEVSKLKRKPGLAVILVGDDPASSVYVNSKSKSCKEIGFYSKKITKPASITQEELLAEVNNLNNDANIDGILVQLPLPKHLDVEQIIATIDSDKDVDGFHSKNIGKLTQNNAFLRPCTPKGIITMLKTTGIELMGKDAIIIGSSNIVGRPMAMELLNKRATVTICHSKTKNLAQKVAQADIVIAAVGIANIIKGSWIKKGAIVIDVGINRLDNGKLVGDVEFDVAQQNASWITPVPGGVGPMTIATLLENTMISYRHRENKLIETTA